MDKDLPQNPPQSPKNIAHLRHVPVAPFRPPPPSAPGFLSLHSVCNAGTSNNNASGSSSRITSLPSNELTMQQCARRMIRRMRDAFENSDIRYALYHARPIVPSREDRPLIRAQLELEAQMRDIQDELERPNSDEPVTPVDTMQVIDVAEGNRLLKEFTTFDFDELAAGTSNATSSTTVLALTAAPPPPPSSALGQAFSAFNFFPPPPANSLASALASLAIPMPVAPASEPVSASVTFDEMVLPEPELEPQPQAETSVSPDVLMDVDTQEETTLQPQQPVPADHVSSIAAAADALNAILQQSLPANEVESSPPVDENEATSQTSSSSTAQEQSGTDRREHFPCSECSRVFRRKFDRDRHNSNHTGNKPYECLGCEKPFKRADARTTHWKKDPACRLRDEEIARAKGIRRRTRRPKQQPKQVS